MLQKNCSYVKMSLTFPVWDSMTAIPSSYKCVVLSLTGQLLDVCTDISACKTCYPCMNLWKRDYIVEQCMRGRPNCDAHSPANRFEPCNNSTTCVEYSLKGTVATACLALLEGDCLSVPMFTYPCSVCCLLSDEYAIRLPRIMYAS